MKEIAQDALKLLTVLVIALALIQACEELVGPKYDKIDTVTVERKIIIPPDTVTLTEYKPRIVYRPYFVHDTLIDTVFETRAFTAYMDTTINCKSLKIEYRFPENVFANMQMTECPDTVIVHDTVITNTNVTGSFWSDVKNVAIGFVGGFVVGQVIK
jgi:hypothetical protein